MGAASRSASISTNVTTDCLPDSWRPAAMSQLPSATAAAFRSRPWRRGPLGGIDRLPRRRWRARGAQPALNPQLDDTSRAEWCEDDVFKAPAAASRSRAQLRHDHPRSAQVRPSAAYAERAARAWRHQPVGLSPPQSGRHPRDLFLLGRVGWNCSRKSLPAPRRTPASRRVSCTGWRRARSSDRSRGAGRRIPQGLACQLG